MYLKLIFLTCLFTGLLLTGCKNKEEPAVGDPDTRNSQTMDAPVSEAMDSSAVTAESATPADETLHIVVVTVNGEEITEAQLQQRIEQERTPVQAQMPQAFQEQYEKSLREKVLNELILETILNQKVRGNGIVVSDSELDQVVMQYCRGRNIPLHELPKLLAAQGRTLEEFKAKLRMETAFEKFIDNELEKRIELTEDELRNYYLTYAERYKRPPQVKLQQITLRIPPNAGDQQKADTLAVAEELHKRLQTGADFADIAKAYSDAPTAAAGGETGYLEKVAIDPALQNAAFTLEIGTISNVITAEKGFHIIKITDRTEERALSYEEAKESIRQELALQKKKSMAKEYFQELKAGAKIEKFKIE